VGNANTNFYGPPKPWEISKPSFLRIEEVEWFQIKPIIWKGNNPLEPSQGKPITQLNLKKKPCLEE